MKPHGPTTTQLLTNLGVTAAVVALLMAGALAVAVRRGRHDGVDVVWGAGFALVALITAVLAAGRGDPWRQALVTGLTVIWAVRLAWHIHRRSRGRPQDPRYRDLLDRAGGNRTRYAARTIYLTQGALLWLVSLPVQLAQYGRGDTLLGHPHGGIELGTWLTTGLGVALWLLGFVFETVGDAQLARFRADPANQARVMDRGLWRYTRHPNYFGDACVWWGLTLLALHHPPGLFAVASALVMTYLLTRGSGARLLESGIGERRPGYADYVARTSGFIPLPPRRRSVPTDSS